MTRRQAFFYFLILALAAILSALLFYRFLIDYFSHRSKQLEVSFLDVGQGDAALIETPFGQNILIDAGPDEAVIKRLAQELPWWERRIDLFVLSHPHADHLDGAVSVLRRYQLAKALMTTAPCEEASCATFGDALRLEGAEIIATDTLQTIRLGEDCFFRTLYPSRSSDTLAKADTNETSIISRLDCLGSSFLFTGDAGKASEGVLLANGENLKAEVLKVGHHGSHTSSQPEFLSAVAMDYAVISVGQDNRYGHPEASVLADLEESGAQVLRTDQLGTIHFVKKPGEKLLLK